MPTITTTYKGEMLFESQMGNHTLTIDVPADMNGSDRGPVPPQLFVASLGSCVAAFVAQYCERSGIDTTGMTVDVDFEKVPDPLRLTNIKAVVNLPNADVGARRKAIEKVAAYCPVKATIEHMDGMALTIVDKTDT